ncbi:hypothetical protein [Massilia sp. 9096]|uniref:hypothetical protein n=1 Tax=Massilia sp. 9096 TaxID=1500894 RepID=UPI00055F58EE|nr:hypothetical protein [Massilia sp. 9096]
MAFAATLSYALGGAVLAADSCSLKAPDPVLRAKAYPGQTLDKRSADTSTETAQLRPGLRLAIRQDGCEDYVTTRFTLIAAHAQAPDRSDEAWIDFARTELGKLLTREPGRYKRLDEFLVKARRTAPQDGERIVCRDGSQPVAGLCSWDSLGGDVFSVKRGRTTTTITVMEYVSA